jgi:3-deoxy-D-manno-octulosonate 8-phosphate phosphatase KdsC-like HAD superfamily phosphatase
MLQASGVEVAIITSRRSRALELRARDLGIALLYQGAVHVVATPAELRASSDPIVQQFIAGRSSGPMETPGF